jgi:hypothetical protein
MADNESSSSDEDAAVQDQLLNEPSEHGTSERGKATSPWAKFTAKHLMRDCPYTVALDFIDTSLWDVPAPAGADKTHTTTWVAKMVRDYNVAMVLDDKIFDDFKVDFVNWTRDLFLKVERNTLKALKTVLRHRGIYTGNNRARVVDSMYKTLAMENSPEWDPAEFEAMEFDHRSKAYERQQNTHRIAPAAEQNTQQINPTVEQPQQAGLPAGTRQQPSHVQPPPLHMQPPVRGCAKVADA